MKAKKILAAIFASVLVAAQLVGCQNDGSTSGSESSTSAGNESSSSQEETVNLKWILVAGSAMNDKEAVFEKANEIIKEKINANVEFVAYEMAEHDQKVNLLISGQEEFDVVFTSNWVNPFLPNVAKDAYIALDDMIDTYAKETKESLPASAWEAAKVNGKIYAVPIQQIYSRQSAFMYREDLLEKYEFDPTTVKSFKDIEPYLATIKENEPDVTPIEGVRDTLWTNSMASYGFDTLITTTLPGAIYADKDLTVVNQYDTPEFKEYLTLVRDWYNKGYIQKDAATYNDTTLRKTGAYAVVGDAVNKPDGDIEYSNNQAGGTPYVCYGYGPRPITTGAVQATMCAVSSTSKNPERALQLINLVNTDAELYNLLVYGIEGDNYTKDENGRVVQANDGGYDGMLNFFIGNVFNTYLTPGQSDDVWEETAKINNEAPASLALGFVYDTTNCANQIAQITAVVDQYKDSLMSGSVDPEEVLPEFLDKLDKAGVDEVLADMQEQIDAWAESK